MTHPPIDSNKTLFLVALLLSVAYTLLMNPYAYADNASNAQGAKALLNGCKAAYLPWQVTTIIVNCIELTMRMALNTYLSIWTGFLFATTLSIFVFSMIVMGIKVFSGIQELNKEVMLYVVKFGLVAWFANSLGGFAGAPFDIVRSLTTIVFGGYAPWAEMDRFFCKFFGTGCQPNMTLANSIVAQMGPLLMSGTMGILVLVIGMLSALTSIYFMFRAIYTYLASITLIAFVLIMSPFFVPLALFGRTTRYLFKWLDYLVAAMLHPVLLFAFLYVFLGTFTFMLDWFVDGILGGSDFSQHWRSGRTAFSWVLTSDPATVKQLEGVLGETTGHTAVQSFVSPTMLSAVNVNPMTSFALDFGANQVWAMQLIVFGFLGLFIVSYLMLSMINYLPDISEAIAGVVIGLKVEGIPFVSQIRHMMDKVKGAGGG